MRVPYKSPREKRQIINTGRVGNFVDKVASLRPLEPLKRNMTGGANFRTTCMENRATF